MTDPTTTPAPETASAAPEQTVANTNSDGETPVVAPSEATASNASAQDASTPPSSVSEPTVDASTSAETPAAPVPNEAHKSAVTYLEVAMSNAIKELEKEGVVVIHGCEDELRSLKSFFNYQMHALKGKLGLL